MKNTSQFINETREYVDYIERHIANVAKAWEIVKEKCHDLEIVADTRYHKELDRRILVHDASKFSIEEFVPYREYFYGKMKNKDIDYTFHKAVRNHYENNDHHPENWMYMIDSITESSFKNDFTLRSAIYEFIIDLISFDFSGEMMVNAKVFYERRFMSTMPDVINRLVLSVFDKIY